MKEGRRAKPQSPGSAGEGHKLTIKTTKVHSTRALSSILAKINIINLKKKVNKRNRKSDKLSKKSNKKIWIIYKEEKRLYILPQFTEKKKRSKNEKGRSIYKYLFVTLHTVLVRFVLALFRAKRDQCITQVVAPPTRTSPPRIQRSQQPTHHPGTFGARAHTIRKNARDYHLRKTKAITQVRRATYVHTRTAHSTQPTHQSMNFRRKRAW